MPSTAMEAVAAATLEAAAVVTPAAAVAAFMAEAVNAAVAAAISAVRAEADCERAAAGFVVAVSLVGRPAAWLTVAGLTAARLVKRSEAGNIEAEPRPASMAPRATVAMEAIVEVVFAAAEPSLPV